MSAHGDPRVLEQARKKLAQKVAAAKTEAFDAGVRAERERWTARTNGLIERVAESKAKSESAFDRAAADLVDGALRSLLTPEQPSTGGDD